MIYKISLSIFFVMLAMGAWATHIRAGEILATRISNLEYEYRLILYRNTEGVSITTVSINFGDGTFAAKGPDVVSVLTPKTEKYEFVFRKVYSAPGKYVVFTVVPNRNNDILNMSNSGSLTFYVETEVVIDPLLGKNSSPVLLAPPIDKGNENELFTHNPAAFDADGDSLVFELIRPKWFNISEDSASVVPGYRDPSFFTNPPECSNATFSLDPKTGQITWRNPCRQGEYNIAFVIREFRRGIQIGVLTRDMQIEIVNQNNKAPEVLVPPDTCITAGSLLTGTITGLDKDLHPVSLFAYGGVFSLSGSSASYVLENGVNPQNSPARMFVNWQTTCSEIRAQPYEMIFKAEDNPAGGITPLSNIKNWTVRLYGPAITNLKAIAEDKSIRLTWKKYTCPNASKIKILRKDCTTPQPIKDSCYNATDFTGQYTLVATIAASDTFYKDSGGSQGLKRGALYCYVLYVEFPEPPKGTGRPSEEVCAWLSLDVPILIKTNVVATSSDTGKVKIMWTKPKLLDETKYKPPYNYALWRYTRSNMLVFENIFNSTNLNDTFYIDKNLNTVSNNYRYYIRFSYTDSNGKSVIKETTDTASTVFLKGFAKDKRVVLTWSFKVPWNNQQKFHYIYRKTDTVFELIDSVFVVNSAPIYVDRGTFKNQPLKNGVSYTYYVTTRGAYICPEGEVKVRLPSSILNNSQEITVIPSDTNTPCPPVVSITRVPCNEPIRNIRLQWKPTFALFCDSIVTDYNVYFTNSSAQKSLIGSTKDTLFIHSNLAGEVGCYFVTAVNSNYSIESNNSNTVCNQREDCVYIFEIPNVFTPNGDGYNDLLVSNTLPQFISDFRISIMNRWGAKVFETSNPLIEWKGDTVAEGIYYYQATIIFTNNQTRQLKGWIHLIK